MMDPKHEAKMDELIANMAVAIKSTCEWYYRYGEIEVEKYNPDDYVLAKILITAAMTQCNDSYCPMTDEYREDLENLENLHPF